MDSRRVERAAEDAFRMALEWALEVRDSASAPESDDDLISRAWGHYRAALDAAHEPAQAGSFVCERKGCDKNGRVDPYGAGPDCKSGGLSPAGSEPATAITIKPSAGGA